MAVQEQISSRITALSAARDTIREKLVEFGLAEEADKLSDCAEAIESISNQGAVTGTVKEGESYTIPAGYHNGSGTVTGVAGGGSYTLQTKTVTPSTTLQTVRPDSSYYGLSSVTVTAIPTKYKDVSGVTATAADVLAPKTIVDSTGAQRTGTIVNQGRLSETIDGMEEDTVTISPGYYSGGTVSLTSAIADALAEI